MSRIREIRERLSLTQAAFGAAIHCTQGNVGFYERGEQTLPVDRAQKLIEFAATKGLRLTLDQVYGLKPLPAPRAVAQARQRAERPRAEPAEEDFAPDSSIDPTSK